MARTSIPGVPHGRRLESRPGAEFIKSTTCTGTPLKYPDLQPDLPASPKKQTILSPGMFLKDVLGRYLKLIVVSYIQPKRASKLDKMYGIISARDMSLKERRVFSNE